MREGQDGRRKKRKLGLEPEHSSDVPGEDLGKGRKNNSKKEKRKRSSRNGGGSSRDGGSEGGVRDERHHPQMFPAASMPLVRKTWTKGRESGKKEEKERRRNAKILAKQNKLGSKSIAIKEDKTKRKRRALQALWRRVTEKLGGGGGGGEWKKRGRKAGVDGVAESWKAVMLADLREKLEEQHGHTLWARAKAVRHELEDGLLLRCVHGRGGDRYTCPFAKGFVRRKKGTHGNYNVFREGAVEKL